MAWDADDVEKQLGVVVGSLDTDELARVIDAVTDHAARHYDLTTDPATDEHDLALIMQSARLWNRRHSPGGWSGADDLAPTRVLVFDPDIARMLSGRMITAGLFGPSESTEDDA